jgi:hypothetical protein
MLHAVAAACPYCGEAVNVSIDEGGGAHQAYVEDCPVCCRPWEVVLGLNGDGEWEVTLRTSDE